MNPSLPALTSKARVPGFGWIEVPVRRERARLVTQTYIPGFGWRVVPYLFLLVFMVTAAPAVGAGWGTPSPVVAGLPATFLGALSPGEITGIGIAMFVMTFLTGLITHHFTVRKYIRDAAGVRDVQDVRLTDQPMRMKSEHAGVEKPDFDAHAEQVWSNLNGLRLAVGRIEVKVGETKVLREANAERLAELSREVTELGKQVARLAGAVEEHIKQHHS